MFASVPRSASAEEAAPYRLQVGDEVEVSIWGPGEPTTVKLQIREAGTVFVPTVGQVQAVGRSVPELELDIQAALDRQMEEQTQEEAPKGPEPEEQEGQILTAKEALNHAYTLQPGDQLDISVWDHDDLSQKVQIRDDGSFSFPLIGNITAAGRSIPEVEKEITDRLNRDYIVNPQVACRLIGAQFSVLGQRGESGSHPLEGAEDLLTAISKAGDIKALRASRVEVIRRLGDKQVVIRTRVDGILNGDEPNIPVLPRDTIYIKAPHELAEKRQAAVRLVGANFTTLGEVERPGAHEIEGPIDILTAVSLAGGITKFGSNRVEVIRTVDGEKQVLRVNLNRVIQGKDPNIAIYPRDTVYVRRRLF